MSPFVDFALQRLASYRADDVHLGHEIPRDTLMSIARITPFGGETPIALLDPTIFGSGRTGLLLTDGALYVVGSHLRLELAAIAGAPAYPRGSGRLGALPTHHGPIALPALESETAQAALAAMVAAVLAWSSGAGSALERAPTGAVANVVRSHLTGAKDTFVSPQIPAEKLRGSRRALTLGLDLLAGEDVLVLVDETLGGSCEDGVAVTTSRVLQTKGSQRVEAAIATLAAAQFSPGMLLSDVILRHAHGQVTLTLGSKDVALRLAHAAHAIASLPWDARCALSPGEAPLLHEPRVSPLLEAAAAIDAQAARGEISPERAASLRGREVLISRTRVLGRGSSQGLWTSGVGVDDLACLFMAMFGRPTGDAPWGGARVIDFLVQEREDGGYARYAGSATVDALALLATVTTPFVVAGTGPAIPMRVTLGDVGGLATGFSVHLGGAPAAPRAIAAISEGLVAGEIDAFARRAAFGFDAPLPHLFGASPPEVTARLRGAAAG